MRVDWGRFLAGLERHVRDHPWDGAPGVGKPAVWQSSPPATDRDIAGLDSQFGAAFPPSYLSFLRACNGLELASHPIHRFLGAAEVTWFRKRHKDWIRAYTGTTDTAAERDPPDHEYYGYAEDVRPYFRPSHFRHTVQITAVGDGAVYLLNPQVVCPATGEWEAWFLANWNPGVVRYRSFAELMWELYGARTGLDETAFGLVRESGLPTVYQDGPGKPLRRAKRIRVPRPPRPIERIARDVRDGDLPTLQRAIKELARLKTPEALELLGEVFRTHPAHLVREDVAHALGGARRTDAVPLLIDALGDEYYGAAGAAAWALARIGDARAVEPLMRLLQKRGASTLHVAAAALAKFREPRAAEMIGEILKTSDARENHNADSLGGVLLEFGDAGLRVLLDAMDGGHSRAKLRALRAAVYFPMAQVETAIRRLAADADEAVRNEATRALDLLPQLEGVKRR
jgi:hypothetical protein